MFRIAWLIVLDGRGLVCFLVLTVRSFSDKRISHWLQAGFLSIYSNIWNETVERYEKSSSQELQHKPTSNIQKDSSTTEFHDHALLIAIARELP